MKLEEHHFFARDMNRDYLMAVRGEGVWVFDENGKRYLDACAGANVSGIGHGVKEIGEAMARQAAELAYAPPQHFLNQPTLELCQRLAARAPEGYNRVMLCSSGSEAIENALKIARQYHVYQSGIHGFPGDGGNRFLPAGRRVHGLPVLHASRVSLGPGRLPAGQ